MLGQFICNDFLDLKVFLPTAVTLLSESKGILGNFLPDLRSSIRAIGPIEIFMWAVNILLQGFHNPSQ